MITPTENKVLINPEPIPKSAIISNPNPIHRTGLIEAIGGDVEAVQVGQRVIFTYRNSVKVDDKFLVLEEQIEAIL